MVQHDRQVEHKSVDRVFAFSSCEKEFSYSEPSFNRIRQMAASCLSGNQKERKREKKETEKGRNGKMATIRPIAIKCNTRNMGQSAT